MNRLLSGAAILAVILVVSTGAFAPQSASATRAICSCPDCPNPLEASRAIVVGRAVSFDYTYNPDGSVVIRSGGQPDPRRWKPIVVRVEVDQGFRQSSPPAVFLPATLWQQNDGSYTWDSGPNCTEFRGVDPIGQRVGVALDVSWPNGEIDWQIVYNGATGEPYADFEARLRAVVGPPLPPATGSGLAPAGPSTTTNSAVLFGGVVFMLAAAGLHFLQKERARAR